MSIDPKPKNVTFFETVTVHEFKPYLEKNKTDDEFFAAYISCLEKENVLLTSTISLFEKNRRQLELLDQNYDLYVLNMTRTKTLEIYKMISDIVKTENERLSDLNDILDSTVDKPRRETVVKAIEVAKRFITIIGQQQDKWLRAADIKELDEKNNLPSQASPFAHLRQVQSLNPGTKRFRLFTNKLGQNN